MPRAQSLHHHSILNSIVNQTTVCHMDKNILIQQFRDAIFDCRRIYVDKAIACVTYKDDLSGDEKLIYMDEAEQLFVRLVIKVFVEVAFSDCVWSQGEASLARVISQDLCRTAVAENDMLKLVDQMYQINSQNSWQEVFEPFMLLEELNPHRAELEASLLKMANIVAKIDGNVTHETMGQLKNLKWQLHQFIRPIEKPQADDQLDAEDRQTISELHAAFSDVPAQPVGRYSNQTARASEGQSSWRMYLLNLMN